MLPLQFFEGAAALFAIVIPFLLLAVVGFIGYKLVQGFSAFQEGRNDT